jgi:hypothetical protein
MEYLPRRAGELEPLAGFLDLLRATASTGQRRSARRSAGGSRAPETIRTHADLPGDILRVARTSWAFPTLGAWLCPVHTCSEGFARGRGSPGRRSLPDCSSLPAQSRRPRKAAGSPARRESTKRCISRSTAPGKSSTSRWTTWSVTSGLGTARRPRSRRRLTSVENAPPGSVEVLRLGARPLGSAGVEAVEASVTEAPTAGLERE